MSKCKRNSLLCVALVWCALSVGCTAAYEAAHGMINQPKYITYRESNFFKDGVSARPLEKGTIPRGFLKEDSYFYTGKMSASASGGGRSSSGGGSTGGTTTAPGNTGASSSTERGDRTGETGSQPTSANPSSGTMENATGAPQQATGGATGTETDGTVFPFPVTEEIVNRGQERFNIFCSMCHGQTGYGDGMVVRRGYKRPPSYHTDDMRAKPVGHYFDVITNGWGSMPSYSEQVPPQDRWAVIAYIRALQLSQMNVANAGGTTNAPAAGQAPRSSTPVRGQR